MSEQDLRDIMMGNEDRDSLTANFKAQFESEHDVGQVVSKLEENLDVTSRYHKFAYSENIEKPTLLVIIDSSLWEGTRMVKNIIVTEKPGKLYYKIHRIYDEGDGGTIVYFPDEYDDKVGVSIDCYTSDWSGGIFPYDKNVPVTTVSPERNGYRDVSTGPKKGFFERVSEN